MKRFLKALALTAVVAAVAAPAGFAGAGVTVTHGTVDLTGAVLSCPDENVVFTGTASFLSTARATPGGQSGGQFLFNLNGVTAVGQTSGTRYTVVGVTSTGITTRSFMSVQTWLLLPVGGGKPLSFLHLLTHIVNANGESVAFISQMRDCD